MAGGHVGDDLCHKGIQHDLLGAPALIYADNVLQSRPSVTDHGGLCEQTGASFTTRLGRKPEAGVKRVSSEFGAFFRVDTIWAFFVIITSVQLFVNWREPANGGSMPSNEQVYLAALGTLVCLLGFLRKPASTFDLARPRFVAPMIVWMATFYQIFWRYAAGPDELTSTVGQYRQQFGTQAEIYIITCLLAFWAGYLVFDTDRIGARLAKASVVHLSTDSVLLAWSFWLAVTVAVTLVLIVGPQGLWWNLGQATGFGGTWLHFSALASVLAVFRKYIDTLLVVASAALLGLSWPRKELRDARYYLAGAAILAMDSLPYAPAFSRGTGLPVVVAVAAYAYKRRRVPWLATIAGAAWTVLVMNVAVTGRGNFGHYAGLFPWGQQFASTLGGMVSGGIGSMLTTVNTLIDAITPTSVSMAGLAAGHSLGRMSTADWLIFQIPFPHFLMHTVKYTVDPTRFLGGAGSWHYLPSVFGDTWIEFGWTGAISFLVIGGVYRLIDRLAGAEGALAEHKVGLFILMLPIGYIALYLAMFQNFRAWWSLTVFGFYLLAVAVYIKNHFAGYSAEFAGGHEAA